MWGVGVWSKVGIQIQSTGVYGIQVRTLGWGVHFWNLIVHKPFPHRSCFMAGSTLMLIQTVVITELVFYSRQHAMGQNVLASLCV
jgi:hypothetical protein